MWVKVPPGNGFHDAEMAEKLIGEHLGRFGASFVAPEGIPLKDNLGRYEVRVLDAAMTERVKRVLTHHYGLAIDHEETFE